MPALSGKIRLLASGNKCLKIRPLLHGQREKPCDTFSDAFFIMPDTSTLEQKVGAEVGHPVQPKKKRSPK